MFTLYGNGPDSLYPQTQPLFQCTTHGCLIEAWHRVSSNQSLRVSATVVVFTFFLSLDSREATSIQHWPDQAPVETVTACCDRRWAVTWVYHTQAHMTIVPGHGWVSIEMHPTYTTALYHALLGAFTPRLENVWMMPHIYMWPSPQRSGCCLYIITWGWDTFDV